MTELMNTLEKLHRLFTGRTVVLASIDMLDIAGRRSVLKYLLDEGVTPQPVSEDPISETGLPQKLRGTIHSLTRNYPANLVADAAMLELPEDVRVEVAKAFLPKKSLREKLGMNTPAPRAELVERETGEVLLSGPADKVFGPGYLRITKDDGSSILYTTDRTGPERGIEHEIEPNGSKVIRTFYRKATAE